MELTQFVQPGRQVIERYGSGGFLISGAIWRGPVLVFPDRTLAWPDAAQTAEALAPVAGHGEIELLLLGLGRRMSPVAPALRTALRQQGIALEAMDTGAACRTYNVLLAEDRRVAAALMPLEERRPPGTVCRRGRLPPELGGEIMTASSFARRLAVAALAIAVVAAPLAAQARDWRGGYHGGYYNRGRHGNAGAAIVGGLLGFAAGAAIASGSRGYAPPPVYYGAPPAYYAPPPAVYYGY